MYEKFGKRGLDLIAASTALILLALPSIALILWVKLDSKGPVFFKQLRYGKDKKPFTVYKFRTMSTEAPRDIATNSFKNASDYITRSGKIMRRLSIDELPQLINVLRGEMSIIGPRPVVLSEKKLIALRDKYGANSIKPGITGWAQVNGRDEVEDTLKARMDGEYVRRCGVKTDAKVALRTILVIGVAAGYVEGHEQVGEAKGRA